MATESIVCKWNVTVGDLKRRWIRAKMSFCCLLMLPDLLASWLYYLMYIRTLALPKLVQCDMFISIQVKPYRFECQEVSVWIKNMLSGLEVFYVIRETRLEKRPEGLLRKEGHSSLLGVGLWPVTTAQPNYPGDPQPLGPIHGEASGVSWTCPNDTCCPFFSLPISSDHPLFLSTLALPGLFHRPL